jgi:hypothetical protein
MTLLPAIAPVGSLGLVQRDTEGNWSLLNNHVGIFNFISKKGTVVF